MYLDSPANTGSYGYEQFSSDGVPASDDYNPYGQSTSNYSTHWQDASIPPSQHLATYPYAEILQQMQVDTPDATWRSSQSYYSPENELQHSATSGRSDLSDIERYIICDSPPAPASPTTMAVDRRQAKTCPNIPSSRRVPSIADPASPTLAQQYAQSAHEPFIDITRGRVGPTTVSFNGQ